MVLSVKPTEKVRTGLLELRAIRATTREESIPPDKKTPIGTSLIIWRFTACSSKLSNSSESGGVRLSPLRGGDQYRSIIGAVSPKDQSSRHPGSSLWTFLKIVRGARI